MNARLRIVKSPDEDLREAVDLLRRGGILAFPTETVYALGVAADRPEAIERLRLLKGRDERKPFQLLVAGVREVEACVPDVPTPARRLMERFWPGPLTMVIEKGDGERVGVRAAAHPIAMALVRMAGGALVATSANRSGAAPLRDPEGILREFGESVDLVIAGGPAPSNVASTVVRMDHDGFTVLREGAITEDEINKAVRDKGID